LLAGRLTTHRLCVADWRALLIGAVAVFLFVSVIITVATDERAAWKGVLAPLAIGSFIFTAAVTMWPASGGSFQPGSFDRPSDRRRQVWQPLDLHRRAARRRSIRRRRLDVPGRREDLAPTVKALSGARRRSVVSRLRCWRGRLQIDVRRRSSRNQWLRRHESEGGRHGGDWPRRLRGHRVP
jgi:hypothetical protein